AQQSARRQASARTRQGGRDRPEGGGGTPEEAEALMSAGPADPFRSQEWQSVARNGNRAHPSPAPGGSLGSLAARHRSIRSPFEVLLTGNRRGTVLAHCPLTGKETRHASKGLESPRRAVAAVGPSPGRHRAGPFPRCEGGLIRGQLD